MLHVFIGEILANMTQVSDVAPGPLVDIRSSLICTRLFTSKAPALGEVSCAIRCRSAEFSCTTFGGAADRLVAVCERETGERVHKRETLGEIELDAKKQNRKSGLEKRAEREYKTESQQKKRLRENNEKHAKEHSRTRSTVSDAH
jgi:hypothetical protein